ncbi:MAG TPA: hypothetical protein VE978_08255 [Chitinophagales bacterium]|nr:hypothetical protein [Chitinophagales bacterium]
MLTTYIKAAMHHAKYEMLYDKSFVGTINGFQGVISNQATLEACHNELEEVLEEWILLRVAKNLPLPEVDGV